MTESIDRLWTRAQRYLAEGQVAPTVATLDSMRGRHPTHARTHLVAAKVAWQSDRVRDAAGLALQAAATADAEPELVCDVVDTLLQTGEVAAAHQCLERLRLDQVQASGLLIRLADMRQEFGEHVGALALLDRAHSTGAEEAKRRFYRAQQLAFLGRMQEAEAEYVANLGLTPGYGRAALPLVRLRRQTEQSNHLALLDAGIAAVDRGTRNHAAFEFARYKVLEDLGRFDDAWIALAHANAIMHAQRSRNAERQHDSLQHMYDGISKLPPPASAKSLHGGPQPIFIIGLPRSGTTVLDRLLANHPKIVSAGELASFGQQLCWATDHRSVHDQVFMDRLANLDWFELGQRYLTQTQWRAAEKTYFIDKQPVNWMTAGWLRAALPGARVLHLVRDPMDVCFSNLRAMFGETYSWSYNPAALAQHYHDYRRFMALWHKLAPGSILDVSYAGLIGDTERTLRRVLDHCGLAWDPACADITRNTTPVSTLSAAQVREPLHARSTGIWRRYEQHLSALYDAVCDASAPHITSPAVHE